MSRPSNFRSSLESGAAVGFSPHHDEDLDARSIDNPFRNSSSACLPVNCAARCERKPPSHSLTPIGLRLRRISQRHASLPFPDQETTT
jgi:hypothetical protein